MRTTWHCLVWILVSLLVPAAAGAQTLTGRVADTQDGAINGAEVKLSSALLPAARTTHTGKDGKYTFDGLTPGRYSLQVESPGFVASIVEVTVASSGVSVPVVLHVAGLNEEVRVIGQTADSSLTKSDVPLRDQPMNVSTVNSSFLETFAVNDLIEALNNVPNVSAFQQYGVYEYYSFRGFQTDTQMVDGVRNEGNRVRSQLSNVDRVEVLKGPASVLSGNEAIGSAVNIVLKKPTSYRMFDSALSIGSWDTTRLNAGASGKVGSDAVLYRVDFGLDKSDDYRHDPWTKYNVTPTLSWKISRNDQVEVRYSYNRNDVSGDSGIPIITVDGVQQLPDVPRDRRYNTPQDFAISDDHNIRTQYTRQLGNNFGFRDVYAPRIFDDEYWVAESMSVVAGTTDVSRTFLYFKHKRRPWTNQAELNGSLTFGVPHNFLVGWDHQDYHSRTTRSNNANITTTRINLYDPVETHQTWTDFTVSRYDHLQRDTEGFYAQDHVQLGSKVTAVGGFRGDWTRSETHNDPVANGVVTPGTVGNTKSTKPTWRLGGVYQPSEHFDVYGQYATSFKPNTTLQPDGSELKPEIGGQIEIGQRFYFLGEHMYANAAAFRIDRRNVALSLPGGWFDQAGQILSKGFETEINGGWSSWSFNVGYGYTDAKYVDYVTTANNGTKTVLSGKTRPRVPRNSFSYQAAHTWRQGLTLSVSGRTLGDQYLTDANTVYFESYSLVNLAALYRYRQLAFTLNLNNLTDTEYLASTRGNNLWYPGEGRRVMGTVRVALR